MSYTNPKTILVKKPNTAHTDYYKKLASTKFGVPYESVTNEMRQKVKTWEMARAYEMPYTRLQEILKLDVGIKLEVSKTDIKYPLKIDTADSKLQLLSHTGELNDL